MIFATLRRLVHSRRKPAIRPRRLPALRVDELEPRVVPTLMGNQLFPTDNPWNEQITNAPVAADSATLVASIGAALSLHPDFGTTYAGSLIGIPVNVVSGTQPKVNVVIDAYASESDLQPIPIPDNAVLEGDPLPSDQNTGDRHLIVYDQTNNVVYETFNTHRPSEEPDGQWHADSEAVWNLGTDSFRTPGFTSADAAGLPILPGLVRPDEVLDQGVITHALRFTVPRTQNAYVYPASHQAGVSNLALPRMGERFRLKADFDISGFSKANQVILQALKDYGMIVADNGSSWFLSGEPSARWSDDDLHNLTQLIGSDFEAVDLTPVVSRLSQSAASTAGGSSLTITGLNFSGGAGLTKVFFGDVAATSFTVNSDSSITVVVPPHAAGAVDVRIQSPYGTSAVVAADRFTYTTAALTGGPQAIVLGMDNQVYTQHFDADGNSVSGYTLVAPGYVQSLGTGHDAAGRPLVFALGMDNQVYTVKFDGNGNPLGGYARLAPGRVQTFAVGSDAARNPEVFVLGMDDQVYVEKCDAQGNPLGGYALAGWGQVRSLAVGKDGSGDPELFVLGLDSQVYALKFDATGSPAGGYVPAAAGRVQSVSVGSDTGGNPVLFVVGMDNQVYAQHFNAAGNSVGGYSLVAAGQVQSVTVGSDASGYPELFVLGMDSQVYALKFDASGNPLGGYTRTASGRVLSIGVGHDAGKHPEVFAVGLDGQLYAQHFDASGTSLGGYALTAPGRIKAMHIA